MRSWTSKERQTPLDARRHTLAPVPVVVCREITDWKDPFSDPSAVLMCLWCNGWCENMERHLGTRNDDWAEYGLRNMQTTGNFTHNTETTTTMCTQIHCEWLEEFIRHGRDKKSCTWYNTKEHKLLGMWQLKAEQNTRQPNDECTQRCTYVSRTSNQQTLLYTTGSAYYDYKSEYNDANE